MLTQYKSPCRRESDREICIEVLKCQFSDGLDPADECEVLTVGKVFVPGIQTVAVAEHARIAELVLALEGDDVALL